MAEAKMGDTVNVHYTGKLDNGTVFDSSRDREPLEFTVGEGRLIPSFEAAVVGMVPGESKTITAPAETAYGPHREDMIAVVEREMLPPGMEPQVGEQLQVSQPDGRAMIVTVIATDDKTITLDANHPLAGKDLIFDIELISIAPSM